MAPLLSSPASCPYVCLPDSFSLSLPLSSCLRNKLFLRKFVMEIVWNLIIRKCVQPQIMVKFAINSEIGSSHPPQLIVSLSGASILPALYSFFPCTWWWSFAVMLQFVSSGQSAPTSNYIPSSRVASSSSGTVNESSPSSRSRADVKHPLEGWMHNKLRLANWDSRKFTEFHSDSNCTLISTPTWENNPLHTVLSFTAAAFSRLEQSLSCNR